MIRNSTMEMKRLEQILKMTIDYFNNTLSQQFLYEYKIDFILTFNDSKDSWNFLLYIFCPFIKQPVDIVPNLNITSVDIFLDIEKLIDLLKEKLLPQLLNFDSAVKDNTVLLYKKSENKILNLLINTYIREQNI